MGDATVSIRPAETDADYQGFGDVCRLYLAWCRERYGDMPWFVEAVFGHQSFEAELQRLPVTYGPPNGRTLIVDRGGKVIAGGAYRHLADGVCELKRLYVTDDARGLGIGRRLSEALMAAARLDGYRRVRLDTADRLVEAISMYRSMGFAPIPPYQPYPETLMPHLVFMERAL